jgi:alkylated DNA repair dioxygenase AlkB
MNERARFSVRDNGVHDLPIQGASERLVLPDGDGILYRRSFAQTDSASLFEALLRETSWQQQVITVYGRAIASPRLSAWHGDSDAVYSYSGLRLEPAPWTPTLRIVRERVEALAATRFNSVLLNLYRDGQDSMGWHSDDEPELGRDPVIASVSFGAARRFLMQHKKRRLRVELRLEDGDVLVLGGATQHCWRHHVPKTRQPTGARINLTFRCILTSQLLSSCSGKA